MVTKCISLLIDYITDNMRERVISICQGQRQSVYADSKHDLSSKESALFHSEEDVHSKEDIDTNKVTK